MKAKMYSKQSNSYLHDHVIDGFSSTHEGLQKLKEEGLIGENEYTQLLEKNIQRLISRIREFRLAERLVCIFFAVLFCYIQANGEDLEMRRSSARARAGRTNSRSGRRGTDEI